MNICLTSDPESEFTTIEISACHKEWELISTSIFPGDVFIKTNKLIKDSQNVSLSGTIEMHLEYLRLLLDESSKSTEFTISYEKSILIIQGSQKSLDKLKNLAEEFAKDNSDSGDHIHLGYIDSEGYKYNWFSNTNIDLILAVRPDF
jgi:hypothetical protein